MDKRRDVMNAAFTVFTRDGYQGAHVDEIADSAGVAKATVYNHFGDKETLFRQAISEMSEVALTNNLAAVDRLAATGVNLPEALSQVGTKLIDCYCDEQSWALRRLLYAEVPRFPELLELVQDRVAVPIARAMADRLARFYLSGQLGAGDPELASEQFLALLTGPLEARSRFGTRRIPKPERRAIARNAADTFLRAFSPGGGTG